jgi:tetratricopeptide (TPR) repeat protein
MTSKPLSSLLLLVCLSFLASPALAGEFEVHYKRGMSLYEAKEYDNAAAELLKAYEIRQLPRVLLNLGTIYRKIGKAKEALAFYERYLQAEAHPPSAIKKDVDTAIAETRALIAAQEEEVERAKQSEPAPVGWDRDSGQMQPWLAERLRQEERHKIYKRAWFWGLIGGIVAAGVITGVTIAVVTQQRAIPGGIDILQFQLSF